MSNSAKRMLDNLIKRSDCNEAKGTAAISAQK